MGLYAFLNTREPDAPQGGMHEVNQRSTAGQRHAGRQHQHRQGYLGAAYRHQPDPGEGGPHGLYGDHPR